MTEDQLLDALRVRIVDPGSRIDMRTVPAPPVYQVATMESIMNAEHVLGFRLPPLLLRLYTEVANGGLGPGAGLIGVDGGHVDMDGRTLGALYASFREDGWPEGMLPLWDWGDGAWSCLDAHSHDERMVTMDETGPTPTGFTLRAWLEAWVTGADLLREIFYIEDAIMMNPFTRKPMSVKRRGRAIKG